MGTKIEIDDKELENVNGGYGIDLKDLMSSGVIHVWVEKNETKEEAANKAVSDYSATFAMLGLTPADIAKIKTDIMKTSGDRFKLIIGMSGNKPTVTVQAE